MASQIINAKELLLIVQNKIHSFDKSVEDKIVECDEIMFKKT